MQEHHPVVASSVAALAEKSVIEADADMLEHADRDDPVEALRHVAIVLQPELDIGRQPALGARWRATASCSCDSVMPVTRAPAISPR